MSGSPLVSVLLPCFEAERTLGAALDSLLAQTYARLEILAIDDASSDRTAAILADYASRDERVRLLSNPSNLGVIGTLDRGVAEARGELIARMDADDVAMPERIERQVAALAARPEIDLLGTAATLIGADGRRPPPPRPLRCLGPGGARFAALFATPVMHPTLIARAAVMRAHPYGAAADSLHTEDYETFTRMLSAGAGFGNLAEPLMRIRIDPDGVSLRHERLQVENFVLCARRYLERTLDLRPSPGAHRVLVNRMDATTGAADLGEGLRLLDRVETAFLAREPGAAAEIRDAADLQRVDILAQAALKGSPGLRLAAGREALCYRRLLLSPVARGYLGAKLRSPLAARRR